MTLSLSKFQGHYLKLFLLFLLLFSTLQAQKNYTLRVAYGKASTSDFGEILSGDFSSTHPKNLKVTALDGGYLLKENLWSIPFDLYVRSSLSAFDDRNANDALVYETTLYLKLYWNMDFWGNRVRLGFGEGASYTSNILYVEKEEAESKKDNNSKILNYLDVSLDFDLGRLVRYEPLYDTEIGWALKHRSGIFGLINNVKHGGSNYNTLYIEKKF